MSDADQAARLRQLFKSRDASPAPEEKPGKSARVIAISGGKGGVGKTNVAANLAIAFAAFGRRVALLDADYALANVDILLGFSPKFTIEHVLDGSMSVGEIIVDGPGGIKVVPASSGVERLIKMDERQRNLLFNALQILEKHFDNLLIDTAAGLGEDVLTVLRAAREVIIITNPEPPAFVDSYALIKHLVNKKYPARVRVVVNQVSNENEARAVYDRIARTVDKFLKADIGFLGFVNDDQNVKLAVRQRRPFVLQYPNSPASRCIVNLAKKLLKEPAALSGNGFSNNLKHVLAG